MVTFLIIWIWAVVQITSCYESCGDVIVKDRLSLSGIYNISNQHNETFEVYCFFNGSKGYTFVSMTTTVDIDINKLFTKRTFAIIRHLTPGAIQKEVKVRQLTSFRDSVQLSFFYSEHTGYNSPIETARWPDYIYLGFLPISVAASKTTQGYRAGGQNFTFSNCDENPNSYIVFYLNYNGIFSTSVQSTSQFMRGWITRSKDIDSNNYMDRRFYSGIEMHMGGCGGLSTSPQFGNILAALGLPFDIPPGPCEVLTPCVNNGKCIETSDWFVCNCEDGFDGDRCQNKICSCPCSSVGTKKWDQLKYQNLTKTELKHLMREDIKQLEKELKVNSNGTSSFRRKKISANDERKASAYVGVVGILLLIVPAVLMVVSDLSYVFKKFVH